MKKFRIMSALAAAALLTGCSSDAPDAPNHDGNRTTPDNGEVMYMALRINTPAATRAEGDPGYNMGEEGATADENHIEDVTLFITKASATDGEADEIIWAGRTTVGTGNDKTGESVTQKADEATAKFQISKSTYATLSEEEEALNFYLICNTAESIDLTTTDPKALDIEDYRTNYATADKDYFVMAGSVSATVGPKVEEVEGEDGTKTSVSSDTWLVTEEAISVDRLASKMRYSYGWNNDTEKLFGMSDSNQEFKFEMIGSYLNQEGEKQYTFLRKWNGSAGVFAIGLTSVVPSNATATTHPYFYEYTPRVLSIEAGDITTLGATTCDYNLDNIKYNRPRTNTKAADAAKIVDVAYFSFKTEFSCKTNATQKQKSAMNGTNIVYAIRGNFIGTFKDFATYTGPNKDLVKAIYNDAIVAVGTDGDLDEWYNDNKEDLVANEGIFQYTPVNNKYYCYYYKPVYDSDITGIADGQKYALVRNHLYDVKINGISMIGYPGDYIPTDIDPKYNDYWFSMTITVNPWQVRQNHFSF